MHVIELQKQDVKSVRELFSLPKVTWGNMVSKAPSTLYLLLLLRAKPATGVPKVYNLSNCYSNNCYFRLKPKHPPPIVTLSNIGQTEELPK